MVKLVKVIQDILSNNGKYGSLRVANFDFQLGDPVDFTVLNQELEWIIDILKAIKSVRLF